MKRWLIVIGLIGFTVLQGCVEDKMPLKQSDNIDLESEDDNVYQLEMQDRYDDAFFSDNTLYKTVTIPAGSNDALQTAIDAVGEKGTVRLAAGMHTESGTVMITHPVRILGEPGAVVRFDSDAFVNVGEIQAGFYIKDTYRVLIDNLEIRPVGSIGGTALLIQDSYRPRIQNCKFYDFEFTILIEEGNDTRLYDNFVSATPEWMSNFFEVFAITNINGDRVRIEGNTITNAFFGVWACDKNGRFNNNELYNNYIGLILCNVPPNNFPLPDGTPAGSLTPAESWRVKGNNSHDNFDAGYLVIDGANHNRLTNNAATNNGTYDIDLVGDSYRFGFFTPTSYDNVVITNQYPDIIIKDCGIDNLIKDNLGNLVDNNADPCF